MNSSSPPGRPRNAETTRLAILKSAIAAFAAAPYDNVGLREIAAGAGVTAMLVKHYFGSKEGLFAEVIASTMADPSVLTKDVMQSPALARELATALVSQTRATANPVDGFLIMLRSASNDAGAEIWREQIEKHYQADLESILGDPVAAQRATIILSIISGFQAMRQVVKLPALVNGSEQVLIELLASAFDALLPRERTISLRG